MGMELTWKKNSQAVADQIIKAVLDMQIPSGFKEVHEDGLIDLPWADEQFATCEIDFPWSYEDMGFNGFQSVQEYRIHCPYRTMPFSAVLANCREISRVMKPDSHMYLWVTKDFLAHGLACMAAMGYTTKNMIVWIKTSQAGKPTYGMGAWYRNGWEAMLFGTRGKPGRPAKATSTPNYFFAPKPKAAPGIYTTHSRKPEEAYQLIRENSPGPRVSLFQRGAREGFYCWGDEADDWAPERDDLGKPSMDEIADGLIVGIDEDHGWVTRLHPAESPAVKYWKETVYITGPEESIQQPEDSVQEGVGNSEDPIPSAKDQFSLLVSKWGIERARRIWSEMFASGTIEVSLDEVEHV